MRRRTLIGSSLLIGVIVLLTFALTRSRSPLRILVSFSGFTGDATGARAATFQITNASGHTIHLSGTYLVKQPPGVDKVLSFGPNVLLTNNQVAIVAIPAPTNTAPWMAVFHCAPDEWRRRLNDRIGPSRFMDLIPDQIRGVPAQPSESPWIDE